MRVEFFHVEVWSKNESFYQKGKKSKKLGCDLGGVFHDKEHREKEMA